MLRKASFGKGLSFGRLLNNNTVDCDESESVKCASMEEDADVEQPSVERELGSSFTSQRGGSSRCDAAAWGQRDLNLFSGGSAFAATVDNLSDDDDQDRCNARNAQPAIGVCWSRELTSLAESNSVQELIGVLLAPSASGQGNSGAHPTDTSAGVNQHGAGSSTAVEGQPRNSIHQDMNEAGPAQQLPTIDSNSLPDIQGLLQTLGSRSRPYGIGLVPPEVVRAQLVLAALSAAQSRERGEAAATAVRHAVRHPLPSHPEAAKQASHEDEGDADGEGDTASGRRGHRNSRSASVGASGATPEQGATLACRPSHLSLTSAAAPSHLQASVSAGSDQQQPQQPHPQHLRHPQLLQQPHHPQQPSSSPVLDSQAQRQQQQTFRLYQRRHLHPPHPMSVKVAGMLQEGARRVGEAQTSPEPVTQPSPLRQQQQQQQQQQRQQQQLQPAAAAQLQLTSPLSAQPPLDGQEAANASRHQHQQQDAASGGGGGSAGAGAAATTGAPAARRPRVSFTGNNDDLIAAMAATGLEAAAAGQVPPGGGSDPPVGAPAGLVTAAPEAAAMRAGGCLAGQMAGASGQPQRAHGGGPAGRSRQMPCNVYRARGSSSGITELLDEAALAELVAAGGGGPATAGSPPATPPMSNMAAPQPAAPLPPLTAWQSPVSAPPPHPPPPQQPQPVTQLQQDSLSHLQQSQQLTPPPSRGSSWRTAESAFHRPAPVSTAPAPITVQEQQQQQQELAPPPQPPYHQQQMPRQSSGAAGAAPASSPRPAPFTGIQLTLDPGPMMSPFAAASYDHSPIAGIGGPFTLSPRGGSAADCRTRWRDTFGDSTHGREEASVTLSSTGGSSDRRGQAAAFHLNTSLTRGLTASGGEGSIGAIGASFSCGMSGLTLRTSADCASGGHGSGGGAGASLGSPGGGSSGGAAVAQKRARVFPPSQPCAATAAVGNGAGAGMDEDGGGSSDGEGDGCGAGGGSTVTNQRNWKAEDLPPPVAVAVTGLSRDVGDDGRRRRITVQGVFHPDLYLSNKDCIYYENKFISRSGFEKAGGSTTAKWHCSIKIAGTNSTTLGNWLTARGLPVLKGGSRKSKRQRAVEMVGGTPPPAPNITPAPPGVSPGSMHPHLSSGSMHPHLSSGSMHPHPSSGSMHPHLSSGSAASMMPLATPSMMQHMRLPDTNIGAATGAAAAAAAAAVGYGGGVGVGGVGGGSVSPAFSWPPPSPRADLAGAASIGGFGTPVAWPPQTPPPPQQQAQQQAQQQPAAEQTPTALQPSSMSLSAQRRAALPSLPSPASQSAEMELGVQQHPHLRPAQQHMPPAQQHMPPAQQHMPPAQQQRPSTCGLGASPAVFRYHSHGAATETDPAARPQPHLFASYPGHHPHPHPHPCRRAFVGDQPPHTERYPNPHPNPDLQRQPPPPQQQWPQQQQQQQLLHTAAVAYPAPTHWAPPRSGAAMCDVDAGRGTSTELLDHQGATAAPESEQLAFPPSPLPRVAPGGCYPAYPPPPHARADHQPMQPPHAGSYGRYGGYSTYPRFDSRSSGGGGGGGGGGGMAGVEIGPVPWPVNEPMWDQWGLGHPLPAAAPRTLPAPQAPGQ